SDPFSIEIVTPSPLKPLDDDETAGGDSEEEDKKLTFKWAADAPFNFALPRPSNAHGNVSYAISGLPRGVFVDGDRLMGRVEAVGTYALPMTLTDEAQRTQAGVI